MHRILIALPVALVLAALFTRPVGAEPYLAVRHGMKCSQCHTNPTGGGKRSRFGMIYAQTVLPARVVSGEDLRDWLDTGSDPSTPASSGKTASKLLPRSLYYSGYPLPFLGFGGDFRFNNTTVVRENSTTNSFDVLQGSLYGSVELLEGGVSFYLDETVAPGGATAREAFAMVRGPWSSYFKAGRIMLPYGLRLDDDTAFIREQTGFNFGVQDIGAEVGLEPGPWSASLAISNGTQGSSDDNKDKQFTGMVSYIQRHWRVGAQGTWNSTPAAKRIAFGAFAGLHFWRLSLLGEIDHVIDKLRTAGDPYQRQLLLYGAANYEITDGVNLKLTYDFADPDTTESDDSFIRVSAGAEYFPVQFVRLGAFYRFRDDTSASPRDNESVVDFELHMYF